MNIPLDAIQKKYDELAQVLADVAALSAADRQRLQRDFSHLSEVLLKARAIDEARKALFEAKNQAEANTDAQMADLYHEEIEQLQNEIVVQERALEDQIAPEPEHDKRSVYLEVRAGAGGQEAALFASDLLKMYTNYALSKGWRVSIESESATDLGGHREAVLHIQGKDVYGHLKRESGVHRVQRVPTTEAQGRVHTSTATVAVLPEAKEVEISVNPADLRIDVYRASGAGGQHVNTTDSAVRITHVPTGVVVTCQDERSQHKNKAKAMKMLQSRLLVAQIEKEEAEKSKQRKEQVGSGMRSEKVRTYNFPQNRVTDHQVNVTLKKLDMVMEGDLGEIIDALRQQIRDDLRQQFLKQFS